MKRSLSLVRETLAELSPGDLTAVVGAALSDAQGRCTLDESYLLCTINCPSYNSCHC